MAPSAIEPIPSEDVVIRTSATEKSQILQFTPSETRGGLNIAGKLQKELSSKDSEVAMSRYDHSGERIPGGVMAPEHIPEASTPSNFRSSSPLESPVSSPATQTSEHFQDGEVRVSSVDSASFADFGVKATSASMIAPSSLSSQHTFPAMVSSKTLALAHRILDIILRYKLPRSHESLADADEGYLKFLALIYRHVKVHRTIPLCLPAFPFKSPNAREKVLGKLPDMAEDLALAHLNGMCLAIQDVYEPGAQLTIISDGLVYNDLLCVPDRDVWAYGEALRKLTKDNGYNHIQFSRLRDLVTIPDLPESLDEMVYTAKASNFRRELLNTFARPDWDWQEVKKSEDVCLTYRGYIRFLETDLASVYPVGDERTKSKYKRGIEYIAKQMLRRGDAFANAVREKYPYHIRLSIHPSTGATKIPISPLPTTNSIYSTPWHCTTAFLVDGTPLSGLRSDFESNPIFELVYDKAGQPSYYREKSELWSWAEEKGGVITTPIYPGGYIITPAKGKFALSIRDVDTDKVKALAELNSPVVMRGFVKTPNKTAFIEKAHDFGKPTGWKFGLLLEVKDRGVDARGLNNVLSAEWMPFHYDGIFKLEKRVNDEGQEEMVSVPPKFQFFTGATPSPKDTGFTVFSSSRSFMRHLPATLPLSTLEQLSFSCRSTIDSAFLAGLPLIVPHPTTSKPCLRYHEPWPQTKTKFDPTEVIIESVSSKESEWICEVVDETLHDRRVAYYHAWEKGDMIISDNISTMHTRSDFQGGSERELWRIHFD